MLLKIGRFGPERRAFAVQRVDDGVIHLTVAGSVSDRRPRGIPDGFPRGAEGEVAYLASRESPRHPLFGRGPGGRAVFAGRPCAVRHVAWCGCLSKLVSAQSDNNTQ